ncbi:MAG: TetM/TetW/TetO/TetS family tetracycline resistance ribosomal protection protein [Clostridia bacterium]|nr:TetM/TetW/TetO/TetS family tetracycline resistance ribosomal protection protein [Clostridia bacterium]
MTDRRTVIGILAHVDAGKTTLAEAMLYRSGARRALGRVDHGDTALDTHALERARGITIFTGEAAFTTGELQVSLLDTPGHVDFSAETERTLQVLDYAIMVISGIDGVQAHTRTLWRLLALYQIPTLVFVTKMDYARRPQAEILADLCAELSPDCVDFSAEPATRDEALATCSETALEAFLETGAVGDNEIRRLLRMRRMFPVFFGSGLRLDGVDAFLQALDRYLEGKRYPDVFGAKVFKISHEKADRLTHMKITGGALRVRDTVTVGERQEKVSRIYLCRGAKYETAESAPAGTVCAVSGLTATENGTGLGYERSEFTPVLTPVMTYRVVPPPGCDEKTLLPKLRSLEEEDPQLRVTWNAFLQEIHVELMGEVQTEILRSLLRERFDLDVTIDHGRVLYKETIEDRVEGVGHYEPLRHYAEVHLLLEPLPRGSGLVFAARCREDDLDRNWQRRILQNLQEKEHLGVLTGAPITDMKITLVAGRAHLKHTEGGDFRQATYRAVRQGLMQAKSVLLEPYYAFRLEVPYEQLGRAISDLRLRGGEVSAPQEQGSFALLTGRAPVTSLNGYAAEVAAYTGGRGRLSCTVAGYDVCRNADEVIRETAYQPESDLENSPDSVFCAHGAGFLVKWNEVPQYMHLESCLEKEIPYTPQVNRRNFHIDDKELEAIMAREFGPVKYELYRPSAPKRPVDAPDAASEAERRQWVLVDGYNVIFAWEDLKEIAASNLAAARERLMEILCNYAAFTKAEVVLVFDAYRVPGNRGERFDFHNIHVVYTKERELGDVYIEKLVSEIGKNERVRVVSSDGLIQLSAVRFGVLRCPVKEFEQEVDAVHARIGDFLAELRAKTRTQTVGDALPKEKDCRI